MEHGWFVCLVPSPSKTWCYPGKPATAIPEEKAGFTATVASPAVYGEPIFIQMCVKGKTGRVHPVGPYPHALSVTHSDSGRASASTIVEFFECIKETLPPRG